MQFTRLRLNGFKSFVDPTDLVISSGLTGVVGPNGCGKSNLLEALRWIMGENRAKQMRGDGMEDVIFAGTDQRPTRNSATVELVIDNSDRLAPAQFNHDDKLEISRRITRDVGSAYKINGKDVRARDVQMLFADASTGAHSPALVRQGQISELINAKPKARRRILEEAAGISGLYQRRHEAELKLNGAEANLSRVEDVIDQLRGRLGALERQAGQARRYRAIAEELRRSHAVLLYLRWKIARDAAQAAEAELTEATRSAAQAEGAVRLAAKARDDAGGAIAPKREEETIAAAVLQRVTLEGQQLAGQIERAEAEIETLAGRMRQLSMDLEREQTLQRDAGGTITSLEEERAELGKAQDAQADDLAAAANAAREAGEALAGQETKLDRLTEEAARLAARTSAAERRLDEARKTTQRLDAEIASAEHARQQIAGEITGAEAAFTDATTREVAARAAAANAETRLTDAEGARAQAQETEGAARAELADAEGETSALAAEVQGLEKLLARDAKDGAKLVDRLTVAPGYEVALGAALGEDLNADTVDGDGETGWRNLPPYAPAPALPAGVAPLSDHVTGPDALLRRLGQTGLVDAADAPRIQPDLQPGQRIVTREGALWRWDGFQVEAGDGSTSAALRLQQRNRLAGLKQALEKAQSLKAKASEVHQSAQAGLKAANEAEMEARNTRRSSDQAAAEAGRALGRAETELARLKSKQASQGEALEARQTERATAAEALAEAEGALAELADVGAARKAVEMQRGEVDLARTGMLAARGRSDELRRAGLAREKRLAELERELAGWRDRLSKAGDRTGELTKRLADTEARQQEIKDEPARLSERQAGLQSELDAAEARRRASSDALAAAETALRAAQDAEREAEREASTRREARARIEATLEGLAARLEEAAGEIRSELETEPAALLETLDAEPGDLPKVEAAEADVARLRRQRDALGSVNLRAEEDAAEVRAEMEGIQAEKADLDEAIAKLRKGIAELNKEGRERLLAAFETVNKRFASLFQHLFGGGEARLVMVESDDPLDAGLEILCQPPGKKLATLSLLSGGEQTLTALSLIFAVFLSNPSPICVLDEVDAPLDDSNVTRFCDLLDEMRRLTETRFLIITHHAITMSRMDRLFGVTMVERGVSQLVSVDLARASQMIDA